MSCLEVVKKEGELILTNEQWTDELKDKSSESYKILASQLIGKVQQRATYLPVGLL
jgi:hypothetical protein